MSIDKKKGSQNARMADYQTGRATPWVSFIDRVQILEVSDGVENIGSFSLENATMLNEIIGLKDVKEIGAHAFEECISIVDFVCGDKVEKIGAYAFSGCKRLTNFNTGKNCSEIGESCFVGCETLQKLSTGTVTCSGNLAEDGFFGRMFSENFAGTEGCTQEIDFDGVVEYGFKIPKMLYEVTITGSGVIPSYAFYGCTNIENIIIVGDIEEIGERAFSKMNVLAYIDFRSDKLKTIGEKAFAENPNLGTDKVITDEYGTETREERTLVLPSSVETIGRGAFMFCPSLKYADISKTRITAITEWLFVSCSLLRQITLPEQITYIGQEAFYNSGLEKIMIPEAVTHIAVNAFKMCSGLEKVYVNSEYIFRLPKDNQTGLYDAAQEVWVLAESVGDESEVSNVGNYLNDKMRFQRLNTDSEDPNEPIGFYMWIR